MPKTVQVPLPEEGETLFDTEEKVFEDIQANPGEKAFVFIHTVPYEGSVALVNLLTATRLVRKGFDVTIVLYGPGVLLASGTRGYPVGRPGGFPRPPGDQQPDQDAAQGRRHDPCLPVRHGRPVRLPRGRPDPRRQGVPPARRARLGPHRLAGGRVPAQHLDGLTPRPAGRHGHRQCGEPGQRVRHVADPARPARRVRRSPSGGPSSKTTSRSMALNDGPS